MIEAIVTAVVTILAAVVPLLIEKIKAERRENAEEARDADLVDPDPRNLSLRLSRLLDKARSRRRSPQ